MSPQLTYHVSIQSAATIVIKPVRMSVMVVTDAQVMVLWYTKRTIGKINFMIALCGAALQRHIFTKNHMQSGIISLQPHTISHQWIVWTLKNSEHMSYNNPARRMARSLAPPCVFFDMSTCHTSRVTRPFTPLALCLWQKPQMMANLWLSILSWRMLLHV